jgi:hypothetical protein
MIRVPVAVEEPQATAINCADARDGLSALVGGPIGLTDWALLEAHLKQCAECRQAEAHLRQLAAASQPVTRPRAVLASLRKAMELARIGVTGSTALVVRRRAFLTAAARDLTPRATVGVMRAVGLAVGHSADRMARIRTSLASARDLAARTIASGLRAFGLGITHVIAHLRASLAIPLRSSVATVANALEAVRLSITRSVKRTIRFRPSVHAVGVVLALAFTLYALQRTDGPQQLAGPAVLPRPGLGPTRLERAQVESARLEPTRLEPAQVESARLEPTRLEPAQAEPAQLAPSLPAPSVEKQTVSAAPPRTDEPRQSPSGAPPRAAALSPPDVSASEPVRGVASSPPTLLSEPPVSATHVVGRLSAKNPGTAARDFTALLADVGGTELGRSHRVRFTAVEVVVPQSRYNEFADGLARIGSWRLEAARFPLPDAVHMTIRVSE